MTRHDHTISGMTAVSSPCQSRAEHTLMSYSEFACSSAQQNPLNSCLINRQTCKVTAISKHICTVAAIFKHTGPLPYCKYVAAPRHD